MLKSGGLLLRDEAMRDAAARLGPSLFRLATSAPVLVSPSLSDDLFVFMLGRAASQKKHGDNASKQRLCPHLGGNAPPQPARAVVAVARFGTAPTTHGTDRNNTRRRFTRAQPPTKIQHWPPTPFSGPRRRPSSPFTPPRRQAGEAPAPAGKGAPLTFSAFVALGDVAGVSEGAANHGGALILGTSPWDARCHLAGEAVPEHLPSDH